MSKGKVEFKDGALNFELDTNEDGEASVKVKLNLTEAFEEAFDRGGKVEGAKVVDFRFELTKLYLKIDTDQDGEDLLELTLDLGEAFDEARDLIAKNKNKPGEVASE